MPELTVQNTTGMLEKALPVIEAAHRVLANNVANANTPGFKPTHVSFTESLRQALSRTEAGLTLEVTHPKHLSGGTRQPELVFEPDETEVGRNDLSTFDIDREMVELTKNSGRFDILSTILTKRYQQMREVLRIP
ncbi:MAG: flagellar basal body rod protein FlgB [Candidatus Abyssubacteria bacterium]